MRITLWPLHARIFEIIVETHLELKKNMLGGQLNFKSQLQVENVMIPFVKV